MCRLFQLNLAPARPFGGAGVEPPRQRLEALLLRPALPVVAAAPRHRLARVVVGEFLAHHAVVLGLFTFGVAVAAVLVALGGRAQMTSTKYWDFFWTPISVHALNSRNLPWGPSTWDVQIFFAFTPSPLSANSRILPY